MTKRFRFTDNYQGEYYIYSVVVDTDIDEHDKIYVEHAIDELNNKWTGSAISDRQRAEVATAFIKENEAEYNNILNSDKG